LRIIIRLDLTAQDIVLVVACWKQKIWFWLSSITFVDKEEFNGYENEEISKK
jgi:hypothetical protein